VIGYRREVRAARARLAGLERHYLHSAAYGTIEYAQHGAGPALLISHPLFGGLRRRDRPGGDLCR